MADKTLVPLNLHNTFEERKDSTPVGHVVHPFMVPLLTELSKKRPTWQFVSEHCFYREIARFTIIADGEELGAVWRETCWRGNNPKFAFDNARLKRQRQRGRHTETKDLKKAVKTILENMYPTTPAEFASNARGIVTQAMQTKLYSYHRDYGATKTMLTPTMERFVLDNPETFKTYVPEFADKVDLLLAQNVDRSMAAKTQALHEDGKTTLIALRGDKVYVESSATPGQFVISALDDLPSYYKQVLGVLKLVPDNTLIPDLGYRAVDGMFFAFELDTVKDNT